MSFVFEPNYCPQCRSHSSDFKLDRHVGSYDTACSRCGRRERHDPQFDDEGCPCGYVHTVWQGAGVITYRRTGEHFLCRHLLNTTREVLDAGDWLRDALNDGAVDPEIAFLTRWDGEANRVEVLVGRRVDLLAGKIETVFGFSGDLTHDDCSH
jgi:hypothetical protein